MDANFVAGEPMDDYNADKSLLRVTTDRIPYSHNLQKDLHLPISIFVKPYGELPSGEEIPSVAFGSKPIVRCDGCRAYVNPFIKFIDGGKRWICNFCRLPNQTVNYYYSPLDANGSREDIEERAELWSGSVDIIASSEYMSRPPMPPTYIFLFDVSQEAVTSGYLQLACSTIKGILEEGTLPGAERIRVSFIAFDQNLYFFNLRSTLRQPQMIVVSDLTDNFLPQPDDLLVNLNDSFEIVTNLLDNMQLYFQSPNAGLTSQKTSILHSLFAARSIAGSIGGKILLFQASNLLTRLPELSAKAED